jgi:hypothetical protein
MHKLISHLVIYGEIDNEEVVDNREGPDLVVEISVCTYEQRLKKIRSRRVEKTPP